MICCIYKHPSANVDEFTTVVDKFLKQLNMNKYEVYILGDMNIVLLKHLTHLQTGRYLDMLYSHNLLPVITKPTRITNHTATLIDHIYTNSVNRLISGVIPVDVSDHLPIFCTVETSLIKHNDQFYLRDYSKFNPEAYLQDISAVDWDVIFAQSNNLHEATARSIGTLKSVVNKHAPLKQVSRSKQKQLQKPWISTGILKSIKTKHAMYKTHYLSNNPVKIGEFKNYSNKHFVDVGASLASKMEDSFENPTQYILSSPANSFVMSTVTETQVTCGVFLDFSEAFDTVNHKILLSKLYHYDIRGIPHDWFRNYRHNRTQFVKIGSSQSNAETITCGIPQGSTLGPLLFLFYINDLPYCSKNLSFRIFADDTNMFFTSDNLLHLESIMNEELNSVFKYCNINKIPINFAKTTYMVISSTRLRSYIHIPNIAYKTQIMYLGIHIDQNLQWGPQTQHINNKLAKNIAIINKLRYFVDLHALKQLYYSFIYPYLSYATIAWGSACKTNFRRILTKQNKCVRSMFFAHSRDSATPYYNLLGILNFENVYKLKVALFTHKILKGSTNISTIFHRSLTRASEIHTYNTRFATKLNFHRPKANNNYGTSTFAFVSYQLWETIPTNIKRLPNTSFCNQYKLYLLNMQSSEQPVY